ncbi:MAG: TonB-dependent receptor [Candidatus Pseudobacter hemicellulosilyticus]|uniref:TonB-dependent receptor n=1 Tax=Candidatus Pseudobacter hemicellulosilyticus TaxID=3121375 RepID=A0AAJ5WRZ8_9BACT|nr:MAG: TonB-dependent receptor [Pseudobacter sp.]
MFATIALSQSAVTGKVTGSADKQPVFGATVSVKGSNVATQTNNVGVYTINVPSGQAVLVISFVGFETMEVPVNNRQTVDIELLEKTTTLTDVVVTGYSSQAKKDITGSVTVVKVADLKATPAANAETQLQGRAAGVTVVTSNQPGDGASVRIRGFGSFTYNIPLYIIDGVPANGLGFLSYNDIESMQVLKDAASASIYGSRANNGVIIVTTKKGKEGPPKVAYETYFGNQRPGKGFDLLNTQEYAELTWLAAKNAGKTPPSSQYGSGATPRIPDYILPAGRMEGDPDVDPGKYRLNMDDIPNAYLIVRANKQGTDWYDELTRNAPMMLHNITVSGANNKNRYLLAFHYFDQDGIVMNNFFKRYAVRLNTEFNIKNALRIGENLALIMSESNQVLNNEEGSDIAFSYRSQPIIPVYDIMGNFAGSRGDGLGNSDNPVARRARAKSDRSHNYTIFGNIYAELDLFKHLTARTSFGGYFNYSNGYFNSWPTYENKENDVLDAFTETNAKASFWTWTNTLSYKQVFNNLHDVQAVVGIEAVENKGRSTESRRQGYFTDALGFRTVSAGSGTQTANGAPFPESALFSLFGKVDYTYNDRYLASFTIRRDGSSRFGPGVRYGNYPAGSLGWRISEENFMRSVSWITDLKLRGSYGIMGNQMIAETNQFTQFSPNNQSSYYDLGGTSTSSMQGFYLSFIGNLAGKWEKNTTANIGIDATLFGGNTEVILDVYHKKTTDLLYQAEQLGNSGTSAANNPPFFNIAAMKNVGVDLSIFQRVDIGGKDGVKLDGTLTFTTYKNEITKLTETVRFFDVDVVDEANRIGGRFVRNMVGQPVSAFFGYKVIGLFQSDDDVNKSPTQNGAAPGRFKYLDADGDGRINEDDRVIFGNPHPDFTLGFNLNASYKNFDLAVFLYGAFGREAINYVKWWTDFYPSFPGGKSKDALYKSWLPDRTNTNVPIAEDAASFSSTAQVNSYYLENASYVRMKNLALGYSIPKKILDRFKIDNLRFYVQATNLFTITDYTGLDPEIIGPDQSFGVDAGIYPTVKNFVLGLTLNF